MYQLFNSMISTFILYLNHSDSDDDDDVERDGEVIVSTPTKISLPSVKNAIMQGRRRWSGLLTMTPGKN